MIVVSKDRPRSGNFTATAVTHYPAYVQAGQYGAALGPPFESDGFLSQVLNTSAGHEYSLTYWLYNDVTTINGFSASFNGTTLFSQGNIPAQSYTKYQYVVTATGSSTTLQFGFRNDPAYLGLDSISVFGRGSSATPEAGTLWGFGFMMCMGGIFAIRRRIKNQLPVSC